MFFRKRPSSLGDRVVAAMSTQGLKHNQAGHTIKVLILDSARRNCPDIKLAKIPL